MAGAGGKQKSGARFNRSAASPINAETGNLTGARTRPKQWSAKRLRWSPVLFPIRKWGNKSRGLPTCFVLGGILAAAGGHRTAGLGAMKNQAASTTTCQFTPQPDHLAFCRGLDGFGRGTDTEPEGRATARTEKEKILTNETKSAEDFVHQKLATLKQCPVPVQPAAKPPSSQKTRASQCRPMTLNSFSMAA